VSINRPIKGHRTVQLKYKAKQAYSEGSLDEGACPGRSLYANKT